MVQIGNKHGQGHLALAFLSETENLNLRLGTGHLALAQWTVSKMKNFTNRLLKNFFETFFQKKNF
jgi:hypothetical protein